jgi:starvation-inducible DNA-binding protein
MIMATHVSTKISMNPTKNDLAAVTRQNMVELLNLNLADALHVQMQAKIAHWNVKGPDFFQLHELFDKVFAEATNWVDEIAERAVQLGGVAEATLELVAERTRIPAYSLTITSGREHVDAFTDSLANFGANVRVAIDAADKAGDMDTSDLFTEISRGVDKMLWFLEAHLQGER